jgi:hypothetical protein
MTTPIVKFECQLLKTVRIQSDDEETEREGGKICIYSNVKASWITQISPTTMKAILNALIVADTIPALVGDTVVMVQLMDQSSHKVRSK